MHRSKHSYLDLSVLAEPRRYMLSSDAAILFGPAFDRVLWANAVGSRFFGGKHIGDLLEATISPSHPIVRQIAEAALEVDRGETLVRGFRFPQGDKRVFLQGEISRIAIAENEEAVLFACAGPEAGRERDVTALAEQAVDALTDFAEAAAVLDGDGQALAASGSFAAFGIAETDLRALVESAAKEADRLVKRSLTTPSDKGGEDTMLAAGVARIADDPARFLLVLAGAGERAISAPAKTEMEGEGEQPITPPPREAREETDLSDQKIHDPSPRPEQEPEPDLADNDMALDAAEPGGVPDKPDRHKNDAERPGEDDASLVDRWYFAEENGRAENARTDGAPADIDKPSTEAGRKPVRFAFSVDENQILRSVSPELAETVGAEAADIVGKKWQDIAAELSIDENCEINRLLEKADTWSGKSVLWPVAGTDMVVPVDLAALPAFNRERQFEGFRGFGIIRVADAVIDSKATGLKLAGAAPPTPGAAGAATGEEGEEKWDALPGGGRMAPSAEGKAKNEEDVPMRTSWRPDADEGDGAERDAQLPLSPVEDEAAPASPAENSNIVELASRRERDASRETPPADEDVPTGISQTSEDKTPEDTTPEDSQQSDEQAEPEGTSGLTQRERRNFSEISRSLSGREADGADRSGSAPEDETKGDAGSEAEAASGAPYAAGRAANDTTPTAGETIKAAKTTDDAGERRDDVLALLPYPVLIYRSGETLYANPELLKKTGYESVAALDAAGGVDALLGASELDFEEDRTGAKLTRRDGTAIPIRLHLKRVYWQGAAALCLSFEEEAALPGGGKAALDMVRISDLENILDTAADGIIVIDEAGEIESINASGEALFNRSADELTGTGFADLFAEESRETIRAYLQNLRDPGFSGILNQGREAIGQEAGGGMIPLFVTIGRVGTHSRYCAVLRDLTEWKKTEEDLVQAKRKAETASEQKSAFLSRMSHEIREPLNAIIGFSDVMIEERFGPIDNVRYMGYLKDINRSGLHMLDLVNDLLDISKIEAGKLELSHEAVDLNQLAAETVALLQPQANNHRIIIRTSLSRAVPPVVADTRSIRQILLNLVSNAIRHSPRNSQVIVSTTYEENGEVGLRIRDTGRGMSESEVKRALEPFSQLGDAARDKQGSSGLGLPLTKALVEANRAYFELDSKPGEGTIAHIQFPSQRVLAG